MNNDPTPFERLIKLEHLMDELQAQLNPSTPRLEESSPPQRHLWPADELLLTRLIRRNPETLSAYESPAELTQTEDQGVLLNPIAGISPFRLCELTSGDAVVWVTKEHEKWLYDTEIFRSVFIAPNSNASNEPLVLQLLPRFIRKVQGREWTLDRRGEMIPRNRPFIEQANRIELEQRIQTMEQKYARISGKIDSELSFMRSKIQILEDQLGHLLKLDGNELVTQPIDENSLTKGD
ncbi:MAG: Uncharacterised protein [Prochlorococcus marinus str. MIT 9215]|nr:MAG: Uncharacterised protein [Prochlorococcus marinus str. MIT 9215]